MLQRFLFTALLLLSTLTLQESSLASDVIKGVDWTKDVTTKKRIRHDYFYFSVGFSVEGLAFSIRNSAGTTAVISNAFFATNAFLGFNVRLGWEDFSFFTKNLYFATEAFGFFLIGVADGLVGNTSTQSISVGKIGEVSANALFGGNIKLGFSCDAGGSGAFARKAAFYIVTGVAYSLMSFNSTLSNTMTSFNQSGFGFLYGVGGKINILPFMEVFLEFNSVPPIQGSGACGLDRTACITSNGTADYSVVSSEIYILTLGLGIKM